MVSILAGACGPSKTTAAPSPQPTIQSLTVSANLASLTSAGQTTQATATAAFSNGTSLDVTATCTNWQTDNPGVLTVSSTGLLTARTSGSATITTTDQGVAGSALLKVALNAAQPPALASFSLSGTITDGYSSGILPNIVVQITDGPNAGKATRTDATGSYAISGISPGTFTVSISAVSYVTIVKSVTVTADTRLDVVLQRAAPKLFSLYGTVQDPVSGGIPFAAVSVTAGPNPRYTGAGLDGNYRIDGLIGGSLALAFSGYGHEYIQRSIDLEADTRLDVTLTPTASCAWLYIPLTPTRQTQWDVSAAGGTWQILIWTNHTSCTWSVDTAVPPWLTLSAIGGSQTTTLAVTASANTTGAPRGGGFLLLPCPANSGPGFCTADRTFVVNQAP